MAGILRDGDVTTVSSYHSLSHRWGQRRLLHLLRYGRCSGVPPALREGAAAEGLPTPVKLIKVREKLTLASAENL